MRPVSWDAVYGAQRGLRYWPCEELVRFISRRYGTFKPAWRARTAILDLGCGNGANTWYLAADGFTVTGVDGSSAALTLAEKLLGRWRAKASLVRAPLTRLPFPDASFEAVVDVQSLQHVDAENRMMAYREVVRVLKPLGAFFTFHLADGTDYAHLFPDCGMAWLPTEEELVGTIRGVGLTLETVRHVAIGYGDRENQAHYLSVEARKR